MSVNIYGGGKKRNIDVYMKSLCHVAKAIEPNDIINLSVLEDRIKSWLKELEKKSH